MQVSCRCPRGHEVKHKLGLQNINLFHIEEQLQFSKGSFSLEHLIWTKQSSHHHYEDGIIRRASTNRGFCEESPVSRTWPQYSRTTSLGLHTQTYHRHGDGSPDAGRWCGADSPPLVWCDRHPPCHCPGLPVHWNDVCSGRAGLDTHPEGQAETYGAGGQEHKQVPQQCVMKRVRGDPFFRHSVGHLV